MRRERYGIEHEVAFRYPDGTFADFTNTSFALLQGIVDALPDTAVPGLRIGDQGIKRTRWYVEGFERFDENGALVRCDPKGIEVRTLIHDSVAAAVAALAADVADLDRVARAHGLEPWVTGFNPLRSSYPIVPPLNGWERAHRIGSPEERTAHLHMVTHGPDLNLSVAGLDGADLVQVGAKLTFYSPWIVPFSFSSPFRDGAPWGGLSARTVLRTGARPAAMVFLEPGSPHALATDPSLTQPARLPAEVGRIEFKACDACPDPALYGELLSLLLGLVLDDTLPGRAPVPDAAAHQHVAVAGLGDPDTHVRSGELLAAAERALADRPADLGRLASLRDRWERRDCPAVAMLGKDAVAH